MSRSTRPSWSRRQGRSCRPGWAQAAWTCRRARLRFFPGFYRHLPDTMRRIPVEGRADGVAGNLVGSTRVLFAQAQGRNELVGPARAPRTHGGFDGAQPLSARLGVGGRHPAAEQIAFTERLLTLLTSCDERRFGQREQLSWWEFSGAEKRSEAFGKFIADGLTRSLVAGRAREMSARTGGSSCCSCCFDSHAMAATPTACSTRRRTTRGSRPGSTHLDDLGSTFRLGAPVVGIELRRPADHERVDRRRRGCVRPRTRRGRPLRRSIAGRAAACCSVSPEMRRAEPRLAGLDRLVTRWMNGIMFYLDERRLARRRPRDLHRLGMGADVDLAGAVLGRHRPASATATAACRGILAVDVSEWERRVDAHGQGRVEVLGARRSARRSGRSSSDHLDDGDAARR